MAPSDPYRDFFLNPALPKQRHYEILRAFFVDRLTAPAIAHRFGVNTGSVYALIRDFKKAWRKEDPMQFFLVPLPGPKQDRVKHEVEQPIVQLRQRGYASTDIHRALTIAGFRLSLSLIDQVLRAHGLSGMKKRSTAERDKIQAELASGHIPGLTEPPQPRPAIPEVADVRTLDLSPGQNLTSRLAGLFLFLPFLAKVGLDRLVSDAQLIGTTMIPAVSYLLSGLALKLVDKERKSHITDWSFDPGLGLFAGLNVMPKTTALTDYSYRLVDGQQQRLLAAWIEAVIPLLCDQAPQAFALDFHPIPHRGEESGLENHYVPLRGKAVPSVLVCFGRSVDVPLLCYATADLLRQEKDQQPLHFVRFWETLTGMRPQWLYFDSKMTTYAVLDQLTKLGISFVTIRRRGPQLVQKLLDRSPHEWTKAVIDTPRRRHQRISYLDDRVTLTTYEGKCRQVAALMGRDRPTLFLTNNRTVTAKEIITRYISRNLIENDLGINVNFFHMDCLSSEVRLNVMTDIVLTVLANGCYRWLSQHLKGCGKMEPKQLYRKFVETGGRIAINENELLVRLDRRAHNPVIAQAHLDQDCQPISWLGNKRIRFAYT